ncbi:thermonuclease family protein [Aliiroseovarius sp.]|uniref:thermonuclease family protein n=1 Tax=Aliiroseovarius sp. TaxID=1872442 RepID=UPI003BAA150E
MFIELLIGFLIVALILYVGINLQKPYQRPPRPPETPDLRPSTRQPDPFNAKRAKPTPSKPQLVGRAFVVDGDTIKIQKTQIRLFGIDAPEMNHPYGKKAKWELVALCKGKDVRAEITDTDDHGRTVAKCYLEDGRDLSAEMVKAGLAIDWPKFSGGKYRHLEVANARKKMWLADARQKGRIHVWEQFEAKQRAQASKE